MTSRFRTEGNKSSPQELITRGNSKSISWQTSLRGVAGCLFTPIPHNLSPGVWMVDGEIKSRERSFWLREGGKKRPFHPVIPSGLPALSPCYKLLIYKSHSNGCGPTLEGSWVQLTVCRNSLPVDWYTKVCGASRRHKEDIKDSSHRMKSRFFFS